MRNDNLIFVPEHMSEIIMQYNKCVNYAGLSIDNLEKTKISFTENYQGQASDMVLDLYNKIKEHTELLRDCFIQMERYVTYTKKTMMELDKYIASEMEVVR